MTDIYLLKRVNLLGRHAGIFNIVCEEMLLWRLQRSEDAFMLVIEFFMTPWSEITLIVEVCVKRGYCGHVM